MTDLAVLLVIAAIGFAMARWLRVPVIPFLLIPGIVLPFFGLRLSPGNVELALELGLAFLVFASGIELNPERFVHRRVAALTVGMTQFVLVGVIGALIARWLELEWLPSLYVGCALATSSTLVALRHLKQRQQMFEPFGRLVTGVLLIQDLFMIGIIIALALAPDGWIAVVRGLGGAGVLLALALVCQKWLMPFLVMKLKLDEETLLLTIVALLFAFVGLGFKLVMPSIVGAIVGAFLAGFSLSAFPINGVARGVLTSLTDFFVAIFFTSLGAVIFIPSLDVLLCGVAFAIVVVFVTPPLVALVAERHKLSARASIEAGLLLAQTSEFSLLLGLSGVLLNRISTEVFNMIALASVITMTLTPIVATDGVTRRLLRWHPGRRRFSGGEDLKDHILVLGFGAGGMWVVKPLIEAGKEVVVVDDDPAVIHQVNKMNLVGIRGDASDERVLKMAGARRASLIIAGMRRVSDAENVIRWAKGVPVLVRVFEQFEAERVKALGGTPISNSDAACEKFMEWFKKTAPVMIPKWKGEHRRQND